MGPEKNRVAAGLKSTWGHGERLSIPPHCWPEKVPQQGADSVTITGL